MSPAAKPCAVGPTTSAAAIVPLTEPELLAGQAGLPPPPQKKTETPPLTPGLPDVDVGRPGRPGQVGVVELERDRRVGHGQCERRVARRVQRRHLVVADQLGVELRALVLVPTRCERERSTRKADDEDDGTRVTESSAGHRSLLSVRRRRTTAATRAALGVSAHLEDAAGGRRQPRLRHPGRSGLRFGEACVRASQSQCVQARRYSQPSCHAKSSDTSCSRGMPLTRWSSAQRVAT